MTTSVASQITAMKSDTAYSNLNQERTTGMKNDSNRINFLDVFRGLSIILIVIIHAMDACQTRVILSAFALPAL